MLVTRLGMAVLLAVGFDAAIPESAEAQLGAIRRKAEEAKKKLDSASKKKAEDSARARPDSTKPGGAAPASTAPGTQAAASSVTPTAAVAEAGLGGLGQLRLREWPEASRALHARDRRDRSREWHP